MAEAPEIADELLANRRQSIGRMPDDMPPWMARTIVGIDKLNYYVGRLVSWMLVPIVFAMIYEVVARYAFTAPTVWAYDISRMFYGAMFVLGAAYGLSKGVHIRSDFIYRNWAVRNQGRVDAILYLVFFFPSMILLLWVSFDWAWTTIIRGERGMDTAFAPLLGPVRSALPIGIFLLIIQGISEFLKSWYAASHNRWPDA